VNIFHESEYIDRKKNKSKNKRRPSILALSVCKGVWAKPIYAFDQTNAILALLSKCQFSAKDITIFPQVFFSEVFAYAKVKLSFAQ